MSIAKHAQSSRIMSNVSKGTYVKGSKFSNFGSIPEDSIYYHTMLAEKADQERQERIAQSKIRLRGKGISLA
jgi:hypothetical protein